ncbi:MAG: SIMPL domain-containing protein, partial [Thermoleophilia bacterium]|nr:SIMPL domain-containing protein [Thermoleophilia bacterium]
GSLVDTIIVSGSGKVTTLPDQASIQVSVENDGATAAEALDANSIDTQKVLDRLKAEGIADNKIETAGVVVYPNRRYDSDTGQETTVGYRAQNTVTVTFDDLAVIGEVFAAVVEAGADNVYGPTWQLSDDNTAITAALTKAIANARMKAEAIAADQSVRLGDAVIISESSASTVYPLYDIREEAAAGMDASVTPPPINPENMEVTASVTVTYRMER